MNPELIMQEIADGFQTAVREGWPHCHVCLFEGTIGVRKTQHTTKHHPIFHTYTFEAVSKGLTDLEWTRLTRTIIQTNKEQPSCHVPQQHSQQQIATFFLTQSTTPKPKTGPDQKQSETTA